MKITFRLAVFLFAFFFLSNTLVAYHFVSEKNKPGSLVNIPSKVLEKKDSTSFVVLSSLKIKSTVSYSQLHNRQVELLRVLNWGRRLHLNAEQASEIFVINTHFLTTFTKAP